MTTSLNTNLWLQANTTESGKRSRTNALKEGRCCTTWKWRKMRSGTCLLLHRHRILDLRHLPSPDLARGLTVERALADKVTRSTQACGSWTHGMRLGLQALQRLELQSQSCPCPLQRSPRKVNVHLRMQGIRTERCARSSTAASCSNVPSSVMA